MRQDYNEAKKLADEAVRTAARYRISAYLPVLDALEEIKEAVAEVRLGLLELPLDRIVGNKEQGRNNAFANNFMPLMRGDSEFAIKWSNLYDSYKVEGIRDAIKVYEYMNQYYVQEGNKRVSVSKYGGSEYILADVTRILPKKTDAKEVRVYYEYLDFYKSTKNFHIILSEPGYYAKLAALLGQELGKPWDKQLCSDLKAAYFSFSKKCESALKVTYDFTMGDAFLIYISIFPMQSLFQESRDQIIKNIKLARKELMSSLDIGVIEFVAQAPESEKPASLLDIFSGTKRYTAAAPLRVGFIYDADIEDSRWINSHEAGRLYVDQVTEDNVVTSCYYAKQDLSAAIEKAVAEKNELLFAVSPSMLPETLRAAVLHPNVIFFNCSMGKPHPTVRSYHGKFYEASFLMGVLAADTLLHSYSTDTRRIGYLIRKPPYELRCAIINAFAVGVSLLDPSCRIALECVGEKTEEEIRAAWEAEGIRVFADIEYPTCSGISGKPGVYRIQDGKDVCIGVPYYNWGRYYAQIVQSVISGAWRAAELVNELTARNYWFGLSTGVVDIRTKHLSYQTRKLLTFFKNAVVRGGMDPFSGELHAQEGIVQEDGATYGSSFPAKLEKLTASRIAAMNWLCDNIDGTLPSEVK